MSIAPHKRSSPPWWLLGLASLSLICIVPRMARGTESGGLFAPAPADVQLRAAQAHAQAADPRLVRTKAAVFDPLRDGEPDFAGVLPHGPGLRSSSPAAPLLIQFEGPVTTAVRSRTRERGFDVLGYLPNRTLVVRPRRGVVPDALGSMVGKRWVGAFLPGYKLDPELLEPLSICEPSRPRRTLDVLLFAGDSADALVAAMANRFDEVRVLHVKRASPSRITVEIDDRLLGPLVGALIRDPSVQYVARRLPFRTSNDDAVWIGQSYDRVAGPAESQEPDPKPYALSAPIWSRGITGAGQIVAVADTGLEHDTCFFDDPAHPVTAQTVPPPAPIGVEPGHRKIVAYNAPLPGALATDDSFRHGTHVASSVAGDDLANPAAGFDPGHDAGDGMAPGARILFQDVSGAVSSSCNTSIVVQSVEELLEQEYASGARISTNSWGSSAGNHATSTAEAEAAAWTHEDLVVLVSAGNRGGSGMVGLATCKNCIAVGASENYDDGFGDAFGILDPENMAAFSSRGPTSDGRLKPDLVAPGFRVRSARFPVQYIPDETDPACDPGDPRVCLPGFGGCYVTDTSAACHADLLLGTSMATPLTAGFAALARQYFTDGYYPTGTADPFDALTPSAALIKAVLINGARNMTGRLYERRGTPQDLGPLADAPSNVQGWGRVMLDDVLYFDGDVRSTRVCDVPNAQGLATGEAAWISLEVLDSGEPLEATLVWSDAPGSPVAAGALVNDLDLIVTSPGGTVYRGNQWTVDDVNVPGDKASAPDPPGKDAVNNVEGIRIPSPVTGLYTIRVTGSDVPGDAGLFTQGAALVVTGAIESCTTLDAPQDLTVVGASGAAVELEWSPVPGALGYTLLRSGSSCSDPMAADHVVAIGPGQSSHEDTDVLPQTTYYYTLRAVTTVAGCETADSPCVTVTTPPPGPPPVPDGAVGAPLRVDKRNDAGTNLSLSWDSALCPAAGYHLIHGALDGVALHDVDGAGCDLNLSGVDGWSDAPSGDIWFLIVANDGDVTEGSWGEQSGPDERGGDQPSGQCGMIDRDSSGACSE